MVLRINFLLYISSLKVKLLCAHEINRGSFDISLDRNGYLSRRGSSDDKIYRLSLFR